MLDRIVGTQHIGPVVLPFLRRSISVGLLVLLVSISSLRALFLVMSRPSPAPWRAFATSLLEQTIGALSVWVAIPFVLLVVLRTRHPGKDLFRSIPMHVLGFVGFSSIQIGVMWTIRGWLYPVLGLPVSPLPLRFQIAWELQQCLLVYAGVAAVLTLLVAWEQQREIQLHATRLDERITAERLAQLTAQVHPHFLFNALNTISEQMFIDPHEAERLLSNIGSILRATLDRSGPLWTLDEELRHTRAYLDVMVGRFGERLDVHMRLSPGLNQELVPCFSIQTLVENAIKHNGEQSEPLRIEIDCEVQNEGLAISVSDDGQGLPVHLLPDRSSKGGLGRLSEVLSLLYGPAARIIFGRAEMGGARVEILVPIDNAPCATHKKVS